MGADLAAACFIATHGRPAEYSLSEFKAAVGVAPTTGRSGSVDKTRKKRGGYAPARALIHLAVQTMSDDSQSLIYEYFARHRGKKKRAFAASKRKLAGILSGIARSVAAGAAPEEAAAGVWRRPDLVGGAIMTYAYRCPVCEKMFNAKREDARYCSDACRQKGLRRRKRATLAREIEKIKAQNPAAAAELYLILVEGGEKAT
ncbi:hypothetical protein PZC41_14755, partial [Staphylococcus aureus]|nr:hypothetical protein [Staphylococcus aureus]